MKPSDVDVSAVPPLGGTFGRVEAEACAALLVAIMAATGDQWRTVQSSEPRAHAKLIAGLPWFGNPVACPRVGALVDVGAVEYVDGDSLLFTEQGLGTLRGSRWNRPPSKLSWEKSHPERSPCHGRAAGPRVPIRSVLGDGETRPRFLLAVQPQTNAPRTYRLWDRTLHRFITEDLGPDRDAACTKAEAVIGAVLNGHAVTGT